MSEERFVSRGFVGKRRAGEKKDRIPPGQYLTNDFPVLSAGPTPYTPLDKWTFSIEGLVKEKVSWTWQDFLKLPMQKYVVDISCVTKWTHLDMKWEGSVSTRCSNMLNSTARLCSLLPTVTADTLRICPLQTSSTVSLSLP